MALDHVAAQRRRLLQAATLLLPAGCIPMVAAATRAGLALDVRDTGARGNGIQDDTRAFQEAIDALADSGGTVRVPAGQYIIDPTRSVRLRSGVHLRLDKGARLLAKPNAAERAYVLLVHDVHDVRISGGEIVGERDKHRGTKGEWGHGVMIRGSSRVTVSDMRISRCWGDGISIGATKRNDGKSWKPSSDVLIERVVCRGNRRQGLTVGRSLRVRVRNSEFSDTRGTKPEYGIDIEPDYPGVARDVLIERCIVRGNRGGGIQVYKRVTDVTIRDCTIERNGYGIFVQEAAGGVITGNRISGNRHAGVALRNQTRQYRVAGNRFNANGPSGQAGQSRRSPGKAGTARGHIQVHATARNIAIANNTYD